MGAVDRADHLCTSYKFARKSLKWWRKMFFWLIEVAGVNSFILYNIWQRQNNKNAEIQLNYRLKLITQLVGNVHNRNRCRGRPSTKDMSEPLNNKTPFIDQLPDKKAKDCAVCSKRKSPGGRKTTVFYCKSCTRKPGLHPKQCFELYHSVVDYKRSSQEFKKTEHIHFFPIVQTFDIQCSLLFRLQFTLNFVFSSLLHSVRKNIDF